jgi:hypothetical protein
MSGMVRTRDTFLLSPPWIEPNRTPLGASSFQSGAMQALLAVARDTIIPLGPTLAVVLAALACEFASAVLDTSVGSAIDGDVLRGLAMRLPSYPLPVQDALLLAMLRLSAGCAAGVPEDVVESVETMRLVVGKHIRRVCAHSSCWRRTC